jgi:hypothetical protein
MTAMEILKIPLFEIDAFEAFFLRHLGSAR